MADLVRSNLILIRPTPQTLFKSEYPENPDFPEYFKKTYLDPGKILSRTEVLSEDFLTLNTETVWKNEEAKLQYLDDPIIKARFDNLITHWTNNGIEAKFTTETIVDDARVYYNEGWWANEPK